MPEAYVYVYLEEGPVPAGVLETIGSGREATARFRYGRRYLPRKDRLAIDPIQLPLPDQIPNVSTPRPKTLCSSTAFEKHFERCPSFGLPQSQAVALAVDTQRKVKANCEAIFKDNGITGAKLERLRTCFIACDEAIQQPEADAI